VKNSKEAVKFLNHLFDVCSDDEIRELIAEADPNGIIEKAVNKRLAAHPTPDSHASDVEEAKAWANAQDIPAFSRLGTLNSLQSGYLAGLNAERKRGEELEETPHWKAIAENDRLTVQLATLTSRCERLKSEYDDAISFLESIKDECGKITGNHYDGKKAEGTVFFIETGIMLFMNSVRKFRQELAALAPPADKEKA
jgi:hypothetical protein